MNPDKHVWDELSRRQINILQDPETALTQEWQALPNVLIQQYVNSMRRRIMAVIRSQGGFNHYYARFWDHSKATSMDSVVNIPGQVMYCYPIILMTLSVFCMLLCMDADLNVCAIT